MSRSSDEGDQRKAESTSRMWAESQPGPSRCQPSRQGYCGYCRVLYSNLEQHLSSLRHLDSVRASSRGSSTISSASSSRTKLTLLERFLQDVLQHHPHRYNDPRPSHADLPSVSAPLLPREELDELRFSDDDSRSQGTREHLPSSDDTSCQPANQKEDRLSAPIREQDEGGAAPTGYTQSSHLQTPPPHAQTPPPQSQALPSVHRKAHRKTNRRKTSDSSTSSPTHRGPGPGHRSPSQLRPCPDPGPSPAPSPGPSPTPGPWPHTQLRPCLEPGPCLDPSPYPSPGPSPGPALNPGLQPHIQLRPYPEPGPSPGPGPGPLPPTQLRPFPESSPSLGPGPGPWPPTQPRPCPDFGPSPGPRLDPGPSPRPGPGPHSGPRLPTQLRPCPDSGPSPGPRLGPGPSPSPGPRPRPGLRPPTQLRPWQSWQKERREALKEEAFSSDHSDSVDQTIEEVIQRCCHGISSTPCQQEETDSFHFSFAASMETQSDDWDSPVQRGQTLGDKPVQVSQVEEQDLSHLMDVQVDLEDQVYSYQLDSALHSEQRTRGGARQEQGIWTLPIEEVLPAPQHIPESFRGKTWTQIEQEDEEKVDRLVRQFRRGRFICYFDTESLARYGRRSQNKKSCDETKEEEPDTDALPLLDHDDDDSAYIRRKRKRRAFRVASRCQVVKVSHSTQTVRLIVPAVRQPASEAPPTSVPVANQEAAERTPEVWRCLPPSYTNIITPLQPRTSLVYLLCSPSGPAPTYTPSPGSTPKRCRKKRRPLDLQGLKVKYKQLPVRFYDPSSNRILKNPPKGFLWRRGSASSPPPSCVRQLFRSLSPDLNADRPLGEGAAGSSRVKGQRSSDTPFSHASFLLSTLSRDSAQTDKEDAARRRGRTSQDPPPPPPSRSERGRRGKRDRTRPPPSKRRTRAQATPPQPRREGLRRAGPSRGVPGSTAPPHPPSPRRGRARRGRGCERGRR